MTDTSCAPPSARAIVIIALGLHALSLLPSCHLSLQCLLLQQYQDTRFRESTAYYSVKLLLIVLFRWIGTQKSSYRCRIRASSYAIATLSRSLAVEWQPQAVQLSSVIRYR